MVKEVTAYANYVTLRTFLKGHCRISVVSEVPGDGSWVPMMTRSAVQLPACLEERWCNLVKELPHMSQLASVNLTTFPGHQAAVASRARCSNLNLDCCSWIRRDEIF